MIVEKLYNELMDFKDTPNFMKFGFAEGGKNREWLNRCNRLLKVKDKNIALKANYLIQLGQLYVGRKTIWHTRNWTSYTKRIKMLKEQII